MEAARLGVDYRIDLHSDSELEEEDDEDGHESKQVAQLRTDEEESKHGHAHQENVPGVAAEKGIAIDVNGICCSERETDEREVVQRVREQGAGKRKGQDEDDKEGGSVWKEARVEPDREIL